MSDAEKLRMIVATMRGGFRKAKIDVRKAFGVDPWNTRGGPKKPLRNAMASHLEQLFERLAHHGIEGFSVDRPIVDQSLAEQSKQFAGVLHVGDVVAVDRAEDVAR